MSSDFDQYIGTEGRRALVLCVALFVGWVSILSPMSREFAGVVSLMEEIIRPNPEGILADRGAAAFADKIQNEVINRQFRHRSDCLKRARQQSDGELSVARKGSTNNCGAEPEYDLFHFYRYASAEEIRSYEAATHAAAVPRNRRDKLRELTTLEIVGTKVVFPKLWGPVIWIIGAVIATKMLYGIATRILENNKSNGNFDRRVVEDSDNTSPAVKGQHVGVPFYLIAISVPLYILAVQVSYLGFLIAYDHQIVRRAAGFDGSNGQLFASAYQLSVSVALIVVSYYAISFFIKCFENFCTLHWTGEFSGNRRSILVGTSMASVAVLLGSWERAVWDLKSTVRFWERSKQILTGFLPTKGHGLYEITMSGRGKPLQFYVDKSRVMSGRKSFSHTWKLRKISSSSDFDPARISGTSNGKFRSSVSESFALDFIEAGEIDEALSVLDNAIEFDFSRGNKIKGSEGLTYKGRLSLRLCDLRATITHRKLGESALDEFVRKIGALLEANRLHFSDVDQKRLKFRLAKWAGDPWIGDPPSGLFVPWRQRLSDGKPVKWKLTLWGSPSYHNIESNKPNNMTRTVVL